MRFAIVAVIATFLDSTSSTITDTERLDDFTRSIALLATFFASTLAMTETERLEEYSRRNYHWPPTWVPPTQGWQTLMERREKQIMSLASSQARWDGWTVMVGSSSLVRNFTEKGFAVVRAPDSVNKRLQANLQAHKENARFEDTPSRQIDVIKGQLRPKFIDQESLNRQILFELQPMFEEWSNVKLKPAIAYGLRIYQNGSSLLMHVDKIEDHVISAILHVGHEYDDEDEPWPLVIEAFDGSTVAVNLEPGEMLFYESAKCMHGRPRPFRGKYYSSIFIHYVPVDWDLTGRDSQYNVPPHWLDGLEEAVDRGGKHPDPAIPKLEIVGTGFNEPECPDGWCNMPPREHHHHYSGDHSGRGDRTGEKGEKEPTQRQRQHQEQEQGQQLASELRRASGLHPSQLNHSGHGPQPGALRVSGSAAKEEKEEEQRGHSWGVRGTAAGAEQDRARRAAARVPTEEGGDASASGAASEQENEQQQQQEQHAAHLAIGDMGKKLRGGLQAASAMAKKRAAGANARDEAESDAGIGGATGGGGLASLATSLFVQVGPDGAVALPLRWVWYGPAAVAVVAWILYLFLRGKRRSGLKTF